MRSWSVWDHGLLLKRQRNRQSQSPSWNYSPCTTVEILQVSCMAGGLFNPYTHVFLIVCFDCCGKCSVEVNHVLPTVDAMITSYASAYTDIRRLLARDCWPRFKLSRFYPRYN